MQKIIQIKNLTVNYGSICALENINLDIYSNSYLAVVGPNGGGKSTLIKAILRLIPYSGSILIDKKLKLGYVPQHFFASKNFPITVIEVVLSAKLKNNFIPFKKLSKSDVAAAKECLDAVNLGAFENRPVSALSGGEFQKLLIARALAINPNVLILDEPTSSIDQASRQEIYPLLAKLAKIMTVIIITHDFEQVSGDATHAIYLDKHLKVIKE